MADGKRSYDILSYQAKLVLGFFTLYIVTLVFLWNGNNFAVLVLAVPLASVLIWISVNDVMTHEIPDMAVALMAISAVGFIVWTDVSSLFIHITVGVGVTVLLWLFGELYFRKNGHEGLGIGDAKLFGAGAVVVGPWQLPDLLLISSLGGLVVFSVVSAKRQARDKGVPFGPFISYAVFILIFLDPIFL